MEIGPLSHPDSIWTWKSNARSRKASVWIPYFEGVSKTKGTSYEIRFNGGPLTVDLKEVDSLFFYGASGDLPLDFLESLNQLGIALLIHRRNKSNPLVFHTDRRNDSSDVLSRQLAARQDQRRRAYVARTLVAARLRSFRYLMPLPSAAFKKLRATRSLSAIRAVEADLTKVYWGRYYETINLPGLARREEHPVNAALDAGSFFLFGVLLRWVLFHRLSPAHAFLHEDSAYEGLAFDLMEPYRVVFEQSVAEAWSEDPNPKTLTQRSLALLKARLGERVAVEAICGSATRKSLLHGAVLALRSYLIGDMARLVLPIEGQKRKGRPPRLSYSVPGALNW